MQSGPPPPDPAPYPYAPRKPKAKSQNPKAKKRKKETIRSAPRPISVRESGEDEWVSHFFSINFLSHVHKTVVAHMILAAHTNEKTKTKHALATFTISQFYWTFWDARSDDDVWMYILSLTTINNR